MNPKRRSDILMLPLCALVLAGLACAAFGPSPETESYGENQPTQEASPSESKLPPTSTPTLVPPPAPSTRLDGSDLPFVNFSEPQSDVDETDRPGLSGSPLFLDTDHFRIHFTLEGEDATLPPDTDEDGIPDFVAEVAIAFEYAWWAEIDHFSWPQPPSDQNLGGNLLYDVYLDEVESEEAVGLTSGDYEAGSLGDNPHTGAIETNASSSYIELENDFSDYSSSPFEGISTLDYMRSTVAHEFLHAIQYGLDADEPHNWFWEASATWIQDETWDNINDGNEYLDAVFKSPDSCLIDEGGLTRLDDDSHWYGSWILLRYLSEHYGHDLLRDLWVQAASLDGFAVWDAVLTLRGLSLDDVFRDYSRELLLRGFTEGSDYPTVRLEGQLGPGQSFTPPDGVASLGADYIEISAAETVTVTLTGSGLDGVLIGVGSGQSDAFPLQNGAASVNASDYEHLYLIVLNLSRAEQIADCTLQPFTVAVSAGGTPQIASTSESAPYFEAPRIEIRLTELALGYLPSGFAYGSAYIMPREDYEYPDFIDVVVPGPGPVYVLDYYNERDEYLSVYASDSPYPNIQSFLDAQNIYSPGEIDRRSIEGQDLVLVDYSSGQGSFATATLIQGDHFIVIEGSTTLGELEKVVSSYLRQEGVVDTSPQAPSDLALIYVPAGFEFYDTYEQEKDEFYNQDDIDWFIPGPGPVTVLDYFNDAGEYVSLNASASPYTQLDQLFRDRGYTPSPEERVILAGYEVFLEDYSDEGGLSYATFIYNDLFIVIEGFITPAEMRRVAESWLLGE